MCFMCEKLKEYQLTIFAIIMALALIFVSCIIADNISRKTIFMTGMAEEIVTSDSATWNITLNAKASTSASAYKIIKEQTPVIISYLKDSGIAENDIDIEPSSYWTSNKRLPNGNITDEVAFYNYSQNIKIKSNDVNKIKFLSTDIQNLTEKNIDINSSMPEYQYSKLSELKIKLLEKAAQDAKERANSALRVNKNSTGKILEVKTGVFQITAPDSTSVSDMGMNDSTTIDKKVTAVVKVTFEIR